MWPFKRAAEPKQLTLVDLFGAVPDAPPPNYRWRTRLLIARRPGDLEIEGDIARFGTPGEGLGRLAYQIMWSIRDEFGQTWTAAQRIRSAD